MGISRPGSSSTASWTACTGRRSEICAASSSRPARMPTRSPPHRVASSDSTSATTLLLDLGYLLCCHYRMATARSPRGTIRKASPLPYYAQLAAILRGAISDGDWPPGYALPSEADLCSMFGLSRTAVRQALAELSAEG